MLQEVWRQNSRDSPIRWFETESNAVAEECQSCKCGFASTSLIQFCTQDWVKFSPECRTKFGRNTHSHTPTLTHYPPHYHLTETLSDLTRAHSTCSAQLIGVSSRGCWYSPALAEVLGFVEGVMFIDRGAGLGLRVRSVLAITPEDFFQCCLRACTPHPPTFNQ